MARKLKAIGYVRVSTQEQAKSGLGLEDQVLKLQAAAEAMGAQLVSIHRDEGQSGSLPPEDRPGLAGALNEIGRGGVLLVAKRDRLGRDAADMALVERDLKKKKARVVSAAGEGTEDDHPDSVFMRRIVDAMAERELALIRSRTKAALAAKKRRGERVGSIPFGYRENDRGKLVRDKSEWRVVEAVRQARDAELSHRDIVAQLRASGFVSPRSGKPLGLSQVQRILKRLGDKSEPGART